MRRSLKFQVLARMVAILAVTIAGMTIANIRATAFHRTELQNHQVEQISQLLSTSRFPLTANVLNDMKSLSGVDFVVTTADGSVFAQSNGAPDIRNLDDLIPTDESKSNATEHAIEFDGKKYIHRTVPINNPQTRSTTVHVLVMQQPVWESWWQSAKPPLMIAAIVFPIAFVLALAMVGRVTRPLDALKRQVQNIAQGKLDPIPLPTRKDEIHDLSISINEMSSQLMDFETETRNRERLQTLLQVGSGMAHQLRNCATGCKMAIELLESEIQSLDGSENLAVAKRQIILMSKYIDRFIKLSQTRQIPDEAPASPIDLGPVFDSVISLLNPTAKHLNVELSSNYDRPLPQVRIHPDDFEQLCINLISNAITATSELHIPTKTGGAIVTADLADQGSGYLELTVTDNGAGPDSEIATRMFEPLVSGSPEGIGLGLALSADIVEQAGGEISWLRVDDLTHFCVLLPIDHSPGSDVNSPEQDVN